MIRKVVLPAIAALIAFVLTMPMFCVGSSDDGREWCETFYGVRLPGSGIDGPAYAVMYLWPLAVAIGVFVLARRLAPSPDGRATSRS